MNRLAPLASLALAALLPSCGQATVGSADRPLRMFFVPSVDAETIALSADQLVEHVERHVSQELYGADEGFYVEYSIPTSYVAVVEAFGTGRADFAAINTFSYILAKDIKKYPVAPVVRVVRGEGETSYKGQIIARADSGIETIRDLEGRTFAYTDPASTAGYILASALFEREGVKLGEATFASKHDNVVTKVYQGQVDAGATYYSPPALENGIERIRDARARVKTQFPDVEEKVRIIGFTADAPNEPWIVRTNLYDDPALQERVVDAIREALLSFAATEGGRVALDELYDITGLAPADDADYDQLRALVLDTEVDLASAVGG